jgi:hypothetical protein
MLLSFSFSSMKGIKGHFEQHIISFLANRNFTGQELALLTE